MPPPPTGERVFSARERAQMAMALTELEGTLRALVTDALVLEAVLMDVEKLRATVERPAPDEDTFVRGIHGLRGKLRVGGVALNDVPPLVAPIRVVAAVLGVPPVVLGV